MTPVANNGNTIRLLTPESELEEKNYLYVDSTIQRCKKKCKHFLIEDFFDLPLVSTTPVVHHKLRLSRANFRKKFGKVLMGY